MNEKNSPPPLITNRLYAECGNCTVELRLATPAVYLVIDEVRQLKEWLEAVLRPFDSPADNALERLGSVYAEYEKDRSKLDAKLHEAISNALRRSAESAK